MNDELHVHKNTETSRYEGVVADEPIGFAAYVLRGEAVELPHTVVPEQFAGRGYAGGIVRFALDDIRAQGRQVLPTCPYVKAWIGKHPEYADLVA